VLLAGRELPPERVARPSPLEYGSVQARSPDGRQILRSHAPPAEQAA
jgi:hypothetical protein